MQMPTALLRVIHTGLFVVSCSAEVSIVSKRDGFPLQRDDLIGPPAPRMLPLDNGGYASIDGPWSVMDLNMGSAKAKIQVYPSIIGQTYLLSPDSARPATNLFNMTANNTYSPLTSTTFVKVNGNHSLDLSPDQHGGGTAQTFQDTVWIEQLSTQQSNTSALPLHNYTFDSIMNGFRILNNGTRHLMDYGRVALGCSSQVTDRSNCTGLATLFKRIGATASDAFGMHIGALAILDQITYVNIPSALYLGGYDKAHIVGPVSTQQISTQYKRFVLPLLDVSLGVADGGSPFQFPEKSRRGFLVKDDLDPYWNLAQLESSEPYIVLPPGTCGALAAELPVYAAPQLGLYIWNTTDPQYHRLVTSPAYIGFTFKANDSESQNVTVNVPFRLLIKQLAAPLALPGQNFTDYFPCKVWKERSTDKSVILGRAFLQGAFVGANWDSGTWFLAQASGPNLATRQVIAMTNETKSIERSSVTWADSWKGHWTPLAERDIVTGDDEATTGRSRLSTGGIAGVSVATCVVVAIVVVAASMLRRRKKKEALVAGALRKGSEGSSKPAVQEKRTSLELDGTEQFAELRHDGEPREMMASQPPVELDTPVSTDVDYIYYRY